MNVLPGNEVPNPKTETNGTVPSPWGEGPSEPEVMRFFQGPQQRGFELRRAIRIFFELLRGFRRLHFVGPCVSVFGSARFTEEHPYYALARNLGSRLARAG